MERETEKKTSDDLAERLLHFIVECEELCAIIAKSIITAKEK